MYLNGYPPMLGRSYLSRHQAQRDPSMANLCWIPPPKQDLITFYGQRKLEEREKVSLFLNLFHWFLLAKASPVADCTRSKGHGKNDNLACGETVIKCSLEKVFSKVPWKMLPTSRRVSAYPDPSRFMLVLFANLKAGFSPSEPGGAGVVSIWIPVQHYFQSFFALDFQPRRMGLSQRSFIYSKTN